MYNIPTFLAQAETDYYFLTDKTAVTVDLYH